VGEAAGVTPFAAILVVAPIEHHIGDIGVG
jgi:hypothetical protein